MTLEDPQEKEKIMIRVECMVVGTVSTNCYFLVNEQSKKALIIDPGACPGQIRDWFLQKGFQPEAILLTHGHFDHILAAEELKKEFQIPIYACEKEKQVLNDPSMNLTAGFLGKGDTMDADIYCKEGEILSLAGYEIKVLETPGHTPGGCCYYIPSENVIFTGDTLFHRSVGRTDFKGGSYAEICRSIKEKLFVLPEETLCYCGHGENTGIGYEKERNPYVR